MSTINGTEGADYLEGGTGDVTINAFGGDDFLLIGSSGNKTVSLGAGRDYVDVSFQRTTSITFTRPGMVATSSKTSPHGIGVRAFGGCLSIRSGRAD